MEKVFNLSKFYKKAYYESVKGYWDANSRAWPNCQKFKMEKDKKSKQEAYQECTEEYNAWDNDKWLLTYNQCYADSGDCKINPSSAVRTAMKKCSNRDDNQDDVKYKHKTFQLETYVLPSSWASYLINRDDSGMEGDEKAVVDSFMKKHHLPDPVGVSSESYFSKYNDSGNNLGGDVLEYTFRI